jgi:hypothetical protein
MEGVARMSENDTIRWALGAETFSRGVRYANSGAVREMTPSGDGRRVIARVQGNAPQAYSTMVDVRRDASGRLTNVSGVCTCPMRTNCKHVAAVALAIVGAAAKEREKDENSWERTLNAILGTDHSTSLERPIGLQFELITEAGLRNLRNRTWSTRLARVALRPVVAGARGGWVKTGISWSTLHYHQATRSAHGQLVDEIAQLRSADSANYYYGRNDGWIYLDEISRRVWAVLAEAQAAGLPMVDTSKERRPVRISVEPATLRLDATRDGRDLRLDPRITIGEALLDPTLGTLIGEPAHGVASLVRTDGSESLLLAPFDPPLTPPQQAAASRGVLRIPPAAEDRFLDEFYPRLRRTVAVSSSDDSVKLPEPEPPILLLTLRTTSAQLIRLTWQWAYRAGDARRFEPLHPTSGDTSFRDDAAEATVLRQVEESPTVAAMWTVTTAGSQLAASATLGQADTITFGRDVLPALREIDQVEIDADDLPDYRAAAAEPVVSVTADQSSSGNDWLDLDVTVTVDGHQVPFDELFVALAQGQDTLILPSGVYFPLDQPVFTQLAALIAEARALQDRPDGPLRIHPIQASLFDELNRLGVVSTQAAQWQRMVAGLVDDDAPSEPPPSTLTASLRPYQQAGYDWLRFRYDHGLGAVLADDMGLGKTIQTLALICHAHEAGAAPFLVVAPTSVIPNWASECAKFTPGLKVATIQETTGRRGKPLASVIADADVVITSYALFRLDYDEYEAVSWSGLVLDEAQFVKNHSAKAYGCAKKLPVPFKLAVTGTPMENNLMELWALLSIVAPGLLASPQRFTDYYRTPIERGGDAVLLAQLRRRIGPLMLRRTKEQVAPELPPKLEQVVELELSPRHRQIYQTHLQRERQKVLGLLGDVDRNRIEILKSLTLLRQLSLDPALVDEKYATVGSAKLDALMEHVDEIVSGGHRVLVFSQFTGFLARARARLDATDVDYCYLDGATRRRADVLSRFKSGTAPVFLISLKAGGFGLNLTEADYCILLDPWWNPATEVQAVDRTHRIGQTKTVMVYRFVATGTIETKVMELKANKAKLFTSVMEGTEIKRAGFSAAEIAALLS